MLAQTPHVTLGPRTTDSLGRTVQESDYTRPDGEMQGLSFDVQTVQVVDERTTGSNLHYGETVVTSDLVDVVPALAREKAVVQK